MRHLAETIPDVIELKAQHYPDAAFVEFCGHIDGKHKAAIQAKSDEMVQQNLPVIIDWWDGTQLREKGTIVQTAWLYPETTASESSISRVSERILVAGLTCAVLACVEILRYGRSVGQRASAKYHTVSAKIGSLCLRTPLSVILSAAQIASRISFCSLRRCVGLLRTGSRRTRTKTLQSTLYNQL